jgi:hypothetical protein
LIAPVDWKQLLELVLYHDVAPILLRSLRAIALPPGVPRSFLAALHRASAANALRNALLFDDLARVLSRANDQRLDVIILKGAALADTVYGDRTLRPMRDVDLLIRREQLRAFDELLVSHGYRLGPEWARAREWHLRHDYHLAYCKGANELPATSIELHWDLDRSSRPFRVDLAAMWARAVPATVAGVRTKTLSPEDTLLHLCLHACKHKLTAGLRSYCDIAEVVRGTSDMDWLVVTRRAAEWGANAFVLVPLTLARDLLGAPVPDAALERLTPASFDRGLLQIAAQAVTEHPVDASLFPDFFDLTWGTSGAVRSRVLTKLLAPDVVAARYGLKPDSAQIWWRYPQRLAHLCRSYGPEFWQFLRRGRRTTANARRRSQLAQFLKPFEGEGRPAATDMLRTTNFE